MHIKKYTEKDRYGNMFSYEFDVPSMQEIPQPDPSIFKPKGTDTVPAMLTPGENVVNAEASRLPGVQPMLDKLNDMGRTIQKKQGGPIPSYNAKGTKVEGKPAGKDTGMRTVTDKKVYETPDGYKVSEQRITVGDNTHGYGHVPSIYEGIQYEPQQVEQMLYRGQIPQPDMRFKTPTEADYYARLNSQNLMNFRDDASYLQEGGFVIDDTMLDAIKQVESGGDPNALSGVGAGGQYQIMPATAQQPGYGVTPISLEDRFDPNKSRTFAKQYLEGIMRANPDFTKDEVITAYHSGVGNVRKAKMGQEELGPRGQEYAGKVNTAMGEVPKVETAMSEVPMPEPRPAVFDDTPIESGFMSAQASTPNRIGDPGYIPEGEDPPLPTTDISIGAITDKREDELFDYKNFQTSALLNNEIAIQNDLENLNKKIEEKKAKGEEVSNYEIERKKELDRRLKRVRERITDNQKAIDEENKSDFEKQIEKDKVFNIEREIDINADIEKKKAAAQAITDQLNAEEDIDQTVMSQPEVDDFLKRNPHLKPEDSLIDKGKKVGGVILDKSIQYFKNAFSSMFNGEELARMAMMYAGSRAMGYKHGASLNYSMKNYIKRVDANLEAAKKFALTEKARDDFTMDSLKEYSKTGDIDVLIPKAKTLTVKAPAGSVYARGFGQLPTFTMSDGTTKIYHGGQYKSPNHPDLRGRVEKMDSQVHGDVAVSKRFADNAASQIKVANDQYGLKQVGGDKPSDNTVKINANDLGQQANAFYRNVLRRNAISVNDAPAYEAAVNRGIAKYLDAKVQARLNKTKEPSLRAYLNAEVFVPLTGIDQGMVKNTSVKNLEAIQDMVTNNIPFPKDDPRFQTQLEKEFGYREIAFKWMVSNDKVAYGKLLKDVEARLDDKGKGWDAFSYWVSKTPESEIEDILVKAGYGK
jgi:hypothetical protein